MLAHMLGLISGGANVIHPGSTPAQMVEWFDDFNDGAGFEANDTDNCSKFSETADLGEWLVTIIDGGTDNAEVINCADNAPNGYLTLTTNNADNDSIEMQKNGEAFACKAGYPLVWWMKFKITDVSIADWFVGLAITDTTVQAGNTDYVGFTCPDSTGDIDYVCGKNATGGAIGSESSGANTTDSGVDLADATTVTLAFAWNGVDRITFYVNGAEVGHYTTNLPDDEDMTPTVCLRNSTAAVSTMSIDYIGVAMQRHDD